MLFVSACLTLFTGCRSPQRDIYLQNERTGFIFGPYSIERGDTFNFGSEDYRFVTPSAGDRDVLEKLCDTVVRIHPFNLKIDEVIDELNAVLADRNTGGGVVKIRMDFPSSWNQPMYTPEFLEPLGYDKGFGGSRKDNLPQVHMSLGGTACVYDLLRWLPKMLGVSCRFTIEDRTAVLKVVEYQDYPREYYPPVKPQEDEPAPANPGGPNEDDEFPSVDDPFALGTDIRIRDKNGDQRN